MVSEPGHFLGRQPHTWQAHLCLVGLPCAFQQSVKLFVMFPLERATERWRRLLRVL